MSEASPVARTIGPLGHILDFRGRARRADFWPYMLLLAAIYFAGCVLVFALLPFAVGSPIAWMYALTAVLVLLAFSATVRRLHDVGWSGWWMAPYVAITLAFIAFFLWWRLGLAQAPGEEPPVRLMQIMPFFMIASAAANGAAILVFVVCLLDGAAGPNRYGADPTGRSAP